MLSDCRRTQKVRKVRSGAQTDAPAQRISCVFVRIFLPLQREMRGLGGAAVVTAALGHVKDLPRVRALH